LPQGGSTWATVARSSHRGGVPTRRWGRGGVAVSGQRCCGARAEEACPLSVKAELASTSPQRRRAHAEACSLSIWRSGGGRSWGDAREDGVLCSGMRCRIRLGSEKEKRNYCHSSFAKPSIKTVSAPQLNMLQETIVKAVLMGTGVLPNGTYKRPMQPCCTLDLTQPLLSYSIRVCFVILYKHFHLPYFFFIYFFY
jgi:hypothetical protein